MTDNIAEATARVREELNARFCRSYDELRNHLRPCTRHNQYVSASRRRLLHLRRASAAIAILEAA